MIWSAIPLAWKIGAIAALVALIAGGYFAWRGHERALGAAAVELADAKAVAAQQAKDAVLNRQLAVKLQARVTLLEDIAAQGGRRIENTPLEPGSDAEAAAAATVRCMLDPALCPK